MKEVQYRQQIKSESDERPYNYMVSIGRAGGDGGTGRVFALPSTFLVVRKGNVVCYDLYPR